jgi:hypothetical protein
MNEIRPVSGYRVEQVMATWMSARARLLNDDPALEHDEAALTELLGPIEGDAKDLIARVCRAAKHAEAMSKAAKEIAAKTTARQKRYDTRYEALRGIALSMMEAMGTRHEEYPDLTVSISAGRRGVHISDPLKVPDVYVEIKTERIPDKATIAADLNAGREVPGAELRNGMETITIRMS